MGVCSVFLFLFNNAPSSTSARPPTLDITAQQEGTRTVHNINTSLLVLHSQVENFRYFRYNLGPTYSPNNENKTN